MSNSVTNQSLYQMMFGPQGTFGPGASGTSAQYPSPQQPSDPASWMSGSALGMPGSSPQMGTGNFSSGTTANGNALANWMPPLPGGRPSQPSQGQSLYGLMAGQQAQQAAQPPPMPGMGGGPGGPQQQQGGMGRQTLYGMMGGGQPGGGAKGASMGGVGAGAAPSDAALAALM